MANASPSRLGPNATYIPPARVGSNANLSVHVGGNANFSVFRYQHVGIPNAKLWRWGSKPKRGPNSNGFASTYSPLQCVTPCIGASHWFRPPTQPFLVGYTNMFPKSLAELTQTLTDPWTQRKPPMDSTRANGI